MQTINLALLGFGNVGQALSRLLLAKQGELKKIYNIDWKVVGIATGSHGIAVAPGGIQLEEALQKMEVTSLLKSVFLFL